jgi:hypothetical protein
MRKKQRCNFQAATRTRAVLDRSQGTQRKARTPRAWASYSPRGSGPAKPLTTFAFRLSIERSAEGGLR